MLKRVVGSCGQCQGLGTCLLARSVRPGARADSSAMKCLVMPHDLASIAKHGGALYAPVRLCTHTSHLPSCTPCTPSDTDNRCRVLRPYVCTAFAGRVISFSSAAQRDKSTTHECYFWTTTRHPSAYQLELGGVLHPQPCQRLRLLPPHPLHLCSVC